MISEPAPSWAVETQYDLPIHGVDEAVDYVGPDYHPAPRTGLCLVQRETSRGGDALREPAQLALFHDGVEVRLSEAEARAYIADLTMAVDQLATL